MAAISLTLREHSWSRLRWGLCLSAFTWGSAGGQAQLPRTGASRRTGTYRPRPRVEAAARGRHAPSLTLEAATSWAVLAAISWEQTMSSSYLPVCSTTLSADSLRTEPGRAWVSNPVDPGPPHAPSPDPEHHTPCCPPPGATYTSCVAPQPTALEAEMRPSVHLEFLA